MGEGKPQTVQKPNLEKVDYQSQIEIERKWSVRKKQIPNLSNLEFVEIEQGYFQDSNDIWRRIRKGTKIDKVTGVESVSYIETIKTKLGENRSDGCKEEFKVLTNEEASIYWPLAQKMSVKKTRYFIPFGDYKIELDFFEEKAGGIVMAEIEFLDKNISDKFTKEKWPTWFKKDITDKKGVSTKDIARKASERKK